MRPIMRGFGYNFKPATNDSPLAIKFITNNGGASTKPRPSTKLPMAPELPREFRGYNESYIAGFVGRAFCDGGTNPMNVEEYVRGEADAMKKAESLSQD